MNQRCITLRASTLGIRFTVGRPAAPLKMRPPRCFPTRVGEVFVGAGRSQRLRNVPLGLTVFATGFITLSLEVLGFRVLAPHFGYSVYVFGALIGLILFSLAVGYWVGGVCSRRGLSPRDFFLLPFAGGAYLVLASAVHTPLLRSLEVHGLVQGTLLAATTLWAFPMVALAAVAPYLVGLRGATGGHSGHTAGWVSAHGTLGSLVGTFVTSFCLLPGVGTRATFAGNAWAAVAVSLLWLVSSGRKRLIVGTSALVLVEAIPSRPQSAAILHSVESAYSRLEVIDYGEVIGLRTDQRTGIVYSLRTKSGELAPIALYNLFAVPAAAIGAKSALVLGVGAGTLARVHEALNPGLRIVGVELDPMVIAVGRAFFGLDSITNIDSVVVADARPFLRNDQRIYDIIEIDVFRSSEIPFYLVTKEFFGQTRQRLSNAGVLAMNIYDPTKGRRIAMRVANTLAAVYEDVHLVSVEQSSFLLVAGKRPLRLPSVDPGTNFRLAELVAIFGTRAVKVRLTSEPKPFTDNHAPIESLYREARD